MQSERKRVIKNLDTITSKIVRRRDKYCIVCGLPVKFRGDEPISLACGHYIRRGVQALRWNLKNCNCQCPSCNGIHEVNIEPYRRKMLEVYGPFIIEDLETIYLENRTKKKITPDLKLLLKAMKIYYKGME